MNFLNLSLLGGSAFIFAQAAPVQHSPGSLPTSYPLEFYGMIVFMILNAIGWAQMKMAGKKEAERTKREVEQDKLLALSEQRVESAQSLAESRQREINELKETVAKKEIAEKETRDFHHEKGTKDQATITKLAMENSDLKSRQDMTPIIAKLEELTKAVMDLIKHVTKAE